jgi:iron(III) transport system permease protein
MLGTLRRDPAWLALGIGAIALLLVFLGWPLVGMLAKSFIGADGRVGLGGYVRFFADRTYREVFVNTLILGVAVTATSMLVGGCLALVVARCRFPLAGLVTALPLITLVIPDVVVAAAWLLILGKQGLVNALLAPLGIELPTLYSWWGMVFVMTLNNYVYAFVAVLVGLKSMDRNLEEAALSLGRPLPHVLGGVTLPLLLPSVFAGALIVFTHVIGSFGVPAILGARTPVLAVKAYNEFVSEMGGNPQMQTTMASLLVCLGAGLLLVQKFIVERRQFQMEAGRTPAALTIRGVPAVLASGGVLFVVALSLLPALVVVVMALAYFLRRVPTSVRAAVGPLHNLKDSIEEASMSLGVSALKSFFRVVLPVIGPSVVAAAVLMWVTTLSELSATVVLYFGGMNTMPIEIFQQIDSGRMALACAYSLVLLLTIFVPLGLARWLFRLKVGTLD